MDGNIMTMITMGSLAVGVLSTVTPFLRSSIVKPFLADFAVGVVVQYLFLVGFWAVCLVVGGKTPALATFCEHHVTGLSTITCALLVMCLRLWATAAAWLETVMLPEAARVGQLYVDGKGNVVQPPCLVDGE